LNSFSNSLRSFSIKLTGNTTDAADLYQETAMKIITNAEKYREDTNFKAWAVTIMRNIFINDYRKKVRRNTVLDQTPNNYYINSGAATINNNGETNMAYDDLMTMVNRLPEEFRTPFWMAHNGYKYDEISETLNAPLGTIKSRIFFARKRLKKMYFELHQERA